MNAQCIIEAEVSRYDHDDPLDKPDVADYPPGFVFVRPESAGERVQVYLDVTKSTPRAAHYRIRRDWINSATGKPGVPVEGGYACLRNNGADQIERWLAVKKAEFEDKGWVAGS